MKRTSLTALLISGITASAFAGGFQWNLQGIQQVAMGGTGTAYAWDAATIFYNPAGISRLPGIEAYGSILTANPNVKFIKGPADGNAYETDHQWTTPFNVYVGGPIKKNHKLGLGMAVYTPFGNNTKWQDDWAGRFISQEASLRTIFFQPTVSYQISEMISVGLGAIYAYGNINLNQALPVTDFAGREGSAKLSGNANGFGFNAGVQIKATEELYFGLTYRSKVNMKVNNGDARFEIPASLEANYPKGDFEMELPLPEVFSFGAAYKINAKFTLQADVNYVGWSTYDTLSISFAQQQLQDKKEAKGFEDQMTFRLGAHYQISGQFAAMIGGAYDPTPIQNGYVSPNLPDANRYIGSVGLTYSPVPRFNIMLATEFATSDKRATNYTYGNFDGKYHLNTFNGGLGISYKF